MLVQFFTLLTFISVTFVGFLLLDTGARVKPIEQYTQREKNARKLENLQKFKVTGEVDRSIESPNEIIDGIEGKVEDKYNENLGNQENLEFQEKPGNSENSGNKVEIDAKNRLKYEEIEKYETDEFDKTDYQWTCPFDFEKEVAAPHKLISRLDPKPEFYPSSDQIKYIRKDKFLINISPFGPNNQFRGFRDTVLLAYYLNRTIILPIFFKHPSDPTFETTEQLHQPASEKVDIEALNKFFMPAIQFKDFSKVCPNGPDVTLFARTSFGKSMLDQLQVYDDLSGLNMVKNQTLEDFLKKPKISKVYKWPKDDGVNKYDKSPAYDQLVLLNDKGSLRSAYNSQLTGKLNDHDCMMWFMPFRNLKWEKALNPLSAKYDFVYKKYDKMVLARQMVTATRRPKSVRYTATKFISRIVNNQPFIGIHWRYDDVDFGGHCQKMIGPGNEKPCAHLAKMGGFNATFIARKIIGKLTTWSVLKKSQAKTVFFASPPKATSLIIRISKILKDFGIKVFFNKHLSKFVDEKFKDCEKARYQDQKHDFLSQLEQEICMHGDIFAESTGSSWSYAIYVERQARGKVRNDVITQEFF